MRALLEIITRVSRLKLHIKKSHNLIGFKCLNVMSSKLPGQPLGKRVSLFALHFTGWWKGEVKKALNPSNIHNAFYSTIKLD